VAHRIGSEEQHPMDARRLVRRVIDLGRRSVDEPRYLFVVTYGRSGSTLVQGLLNTLPGTLIRGENNFYVLPLYTAWSQVRTFQRQHAKEARKGVQSAFYGLDEMQPDDFVATTRELVRRQLYGTRPRGEIRVLGFKEVLWHRIPPRQTQAFFDFLEAVFPGARYVLNRRDHEQVATSGFWRSKEKDEVLAAISRVEDIQDHLRETRPERTLDIGYEQLTGDDDAVAEQQLRSLAEFTVGHCDAEMMATMRSTLQQGHGPRPFGTSRVEDDVPPPG
jgi:hypothetical protein